MSISVSNIENTSNAINVTTSSGSSNITVTSLSSTPSRIDVHGAGGSNNVSVSNIADFYKLAKDWAIKTDGLVENTDYSAKQYALNASASSTSATNAANSILNNAGFIAVKDDLTNIDTVANSISAVDSVGSIVSSVVTVAGMSSNISSIISNATNINLVAGSITSVNNVASDLTAINTVNNDLAKINAVYDDLTAINTNATNIVAIQNASTNAQTATTKAGEANTSANNSRIWAEGTDVEVQTLGGTHSAKKWVELIGLSFKGSYDVSTTYSLNDFVSNQSGSTTSFYISVVNQNIGHSLTDTAYWKFMWSITDSQSVSFAAITGQPTDNTNLANALKFKTRKWY